MDEMNRYPDLDTSEALIRLASHHVMNALTNVDEEQMKEVPIEKLIKETNGLIRAAAYKKRIEVQNRDNYEAGLEAVKSLVFEAMAKENPELYRQVSAYLNKKKNLLACVQRRLRYLKQHHKVLYYNLLTSGKLNGHPCSCPEGKSSDTLRRFMVTERIHPVCRICIPEHELQCG